MWSVPLTNFTEARTMCQSILAEGAFSCGGAGGTSPPVQRPISATTITANAAREEWKPSGCSYTSTPPSRIPPRIAI